MKFILIIFTAAVLLSCVEASDSGTFEKKERLEHENDSLAKIVIRLEHENDSLRDLNSRWDYSRNYSMMVGNSRYYLNNSDLESLKWGYQLFFDEDLLDRPSTAKSSHTTWSSSDDIMYLYEASNLDDIFIIDSKFEADRFNYFISTIMVNIYASMLIDAGNEVVVNSDIPEKDRLKMVNLLVGLAYKDLYREFSSEKGFEEQLIETVKYIMNNIK